MADGIVYVVDDDEDFREWLDQMLTNASFTTRCFDSASRVLKEFEPNSNSILLTDIKMPDVDGLEFMHKALAIDPDLPVILVTGHGDVKTAVQAMRDGAYDYIVKPVDKSMLIGSVRRALEKRALVLENKSLRSQVLSVPGEHGVLKGDSPAIVRLRELIGNIADLDVNVLIKGETGTGKELVARCLHSQSNRSGKNFVAINCGAVPEPIFDSELFGHEAGAFTSAVKQRIGMIEHASGGTLFLDEIDSMPLSLQVKLLRVLEDRSIQRLGSNKIIPVDVRIIAATQSDLQTIAAEGKFREDLYYRLNVIPVNLPPLRERKTDIPTLFQYFLTKSCTRYQRPVPPLNAGVVGHLMAAEWPGNVRELQNMAERVALSGYTSLFEAAQIVIDNSEFHEKSLPEIVAMIEKRMLEREVARHHGNIDQTSEALKVPRKTLYDKFKKHGINPADYRK